MSVSASEQTADIAAVPEATKGRRFVRSAPESGEPPKLSARQRLELLCDPHSLHPLATAVRSIRSASKAKPGDGVLAASGRIEGRSVLCYASDPSCMAGSLGERQADVIVSVVRLARRARVPVIGIIESAGARLQEGVSALDGYARVFREIVAANREVPHISIIAGVSAGGGAYSPALTDFVVMAPDARMFLTGPKVVRESVGEAVSAEELGGPSVHDRNGVCHILASDALEAIAIGRELLGYLPQYVGGPQTMSRPHLPHEDRPDLRVPAEARRSYDVRHVLDGLVDGGDLLEISSRWARNIVTAFARLEGRPVGVIANQPRHFGGLLDVESCQKACHFIEACDRFGLPMLVLVDTPGFMPGTRQEGGGVIRHGAKLVRAFASATVPSLTLVLRKAYGGAYIAMNSKGLGADLTLAWPDAEIGIMGGQQAAQIVHHREIAAADDPVGALAQLAEQYAERHLTADAAAAEGVVDEVIAPEHTREHLAWALSLLMRNGHG